MHQQAYDWVARFAIDNTAASVLDIGGRNINGSVRGLFADAEYTAIDLYDGDGVDVVADVTLWDTDKTFDVVVCCEVLEHVANWREILQTAYERCKPGGQLIMTCAGPGRHEHSGIDGNQRRASEHYANIAPDELDTELTAAGWTSFELNVAGEDVRAMAIR